MDYFIAHDKIEKKLCDILKKFPHHRKLSKRFEMKHCFMNVQTNVPYYKALDLPSCIKDWFVQPGFNVYQNLQEHRSSSESLSSS